MQVTFLEHWDSEDDARSAWREAYRDASKVRCIEDVPCSGTRFAVSITSFLALSQCHNLACS